MKCENIISSYIVQNNLEIARVVNDYYNYVSTIIKNTHSLSIEDEEEIISDVFLIIWKNRNKLDKNAKFSSYIAGVTRKVMYRKYNEIKRSIQVVNYEDEIIDNFDIDNIMQEKEINNLIFHNLEQIDYEIFTKFYYENKKVKNIAKEMNLSVSNVKTKLHRIRKKIKGILRDSEAL